MEIREIEIAVGLVTLALAIPASAFSQSTIPAMDDQTRGAVAVGITMYILPTIIALWRKHPSRGSIVLVDLLLGWTGIGWLAALIWSFGSTKQHVVIVSPTASNVAANPQSAPVGDLVSSKSVGERIADLKTMLDSGAISQTEFELLKADAFKAMH
jgi:hypothetical protein